MFTILLLLSVESASFGKMPKLCINFGTDFAEAQSPSDCPALAQSKSEGRDCYNEYLKNCIEKVRYNQYNQREREVDAKANRPETSGHRMIQTGKRTLEGGWVQEGEFEKGRFIRGRQYLWDENESLYIDEGEFKSGVLIKGKRIFRRGNVDEGQWFNGQLVKGKRMDKNGFVYEEGEWIDGIMRDGKRINRNDGTFKEGQFDEFGLFLFHGTRTTIGGELEEGWFEKGYFTRGKRTYSDGKIQEGEFEKGSFSNGRVVLPDGEIHEGQFSGRSLKFGKRIRVDGTIEEGEFSSFGEMIGDFHLLNGTKTLLNGEIIRYENGEPKSIFSCSTASFSSSFLILFMSIFGIRTNRK